MNHLYENHLGGWYVLDDYDEPEYCEQCGDCDRYLGCFKNNQDIATELYRQNATSEEIERLTGVEL